MKLTRQARFGLWSLLAAVVAVVSFFVGGMLKPGEEPGFVFDVEAPAFAGDLGEIAAMSPGGFTGFEELIEGGSRTVLGGQILELTSEGMALETPTGVQTRLRLLDAPRIERLESAGRELLVPGASVLVRLDETGGVAAAVLVLASP